MSRARREGTGVQPRPLGVRTISVNENELVTVAKGLGRGPVGAGQSKPDEGDVTWGGASVMLPLMDPDSLLNLYSLSDTLRQCIDAVAHNVDGHGWTVEPAIDLEAEDAAEQVATAMYLDELARDQEAQPPTPDEVNATLAKWKARAKRERFKLRNFIETCCYETPFTELRRRTSIDRETIGWGAWEVVRVDGRIVRFIHIPARTLRLTRQEEKPVAVQTRVSTSVVTSRPVEVMKVFRKIVQVNERGASIYFREFGDPRVMSSQSGNVYPTVEEMKGKEPQAEPANEVLWFTNYYPGTPYGSPRWHGQVPGVVGNRLAQEINCEYLGDAAIPRALLLVADGRLSKSSEKQLKEFFETHKGKAHNRIAIVEASTPREQSVLDGSGRVKLEWVGLRDSQREDATFEKYTESNGDKVGEAFRLPPIMRGKTKDFNRATADAALAYAEEQVFAPLRYLFDQTMNRQILPELGINFWRFKSRGPMRQDPEVLAKVGAELLKQGVITPAEFRSVAEHLLGIDLTTSAGPWQRLPMQLILAGHQPPQVREAESTSADSNVTVQPSEAAAQGRQGADVVDASPEAMAKTILKLRARLETARAAHAMAEADALESIIETVQDR